ncbi:MAG TPA: nucleotidyl transferase AbiEii/AbiGii toxin family protein [Dongiaceae bacterium]
MLTGSGKGRVKISFFAALKIGRIGQPEWTEDGVLQVAALEDLLATKLKVLLKRVEAKDYLDVAAMLDAGAELSVGLASARIPYGEAFQPAECLKALTYFEGGDLKALRPAIRSRLINASAAVVVLPRTNRSSRRLSLSTPSAANRRRG